MTEAQERIIAGLKERFPHSSKSFHVCTDTFGSIATAFPNGKQIVLCGVVVCLNPCFTRICSGTVTLVSFRLVPK